MFLKSDISWANIVEEYTNNPRDVITIPTDDARDGIWFYVHTEKGNVYITDAEFHTESSRVSNPIKLQEKHFEDMLSLYRRRKNGESISQEAKNVSFQQVYWYGIFADLGI